MARRSRSGAFLGGDAAEEQEAMAAGEGGMGLGAEVHHLFVGVV
jgi:hypothetical protein